MTDRYAVFGHNIQYSKSPLIHRLFAEQKDQNIKYSNQEVALDGFNQAGDEFFAAGGKGLNVTVPFKLDAFAFANTLSDRAKLAGAVNTLKKMEDGKIYGDNTDGCGLVRDITNNLGWEIKNKNILILGAGGAVRGIMGPILNQNPKSVTIANRTLETAEKLKENFSHSRDKIHIWDLSEKFHTNTPRYDLIINGTSEGFKDKDGNLSHFVHAVTSPDNSYFYDITYGKNANFFLDLARERNCEGAADGLGMLVEQAAESFNIWRGVMPDTQSVIKQIRKNL